MNWDDEPFVKLYTRDTVEFKLLPWQGKALLPLILRKVDRAGVMDIGTHDPAEALAAIVDMPIEVVEPGLKALLESETLELGDKVIIATNYIEAQSATQSDKARQRASRERRRAVTKRDIQSQTVTKCHAVSQPVTPRIEENRIELKKEIKKKKDFLISEIFEFWQTTLNHTGAKLDAKRKSVIKSALKSYPKEDLYDAIRGCKMSDWHTGANDKGKKYDDIVSIFANASRIEGHRDRYRNVSHHLDIGPPDRRTCTPLLTKLTAIGGEHE